MIIRIASLSYGEIYTKMLYTYGLPSLQHDIDRLLEEGITIQIAIYTSFKDLIEEECKFSIENKDSFFFLALPDHIWSKGSLYNLFKLSLHLNHCFAVPHIRVSDTWDYNDFPVDSKSMVKLAIENSHELFTKNFDTLNMNYCHLGLTLRQIDNGLIGLKHNLPSVFMAKLNQSDLDFYRSNGYTIGQWDRGWIERLISEDRFRIIGSSEIAFMVELTGIIEQLGDTQSNSYNDTYFVDSEYNKISRITVYGLSYS